MTELGSIPAEILLEVARYLSVESFLSLTAASKYYNQFRDERFWKRLVTERFEDGTARFFSDGFGRETKWRSLFEVLVKQDSKARVFPLKDLEAEDYLETCWQYGEDVVHPMSGPFAKIPESTGVDGWNTEEGMMAVASFLSTRAIPGLKELGIRHGDAVSLTFPTKRTNKTVHFFYSERSDLILPRVIIDGEAVVPKEFQVIRDLPIRYWRGCKASDRVWCDLSHYADEIRKNMVDLNGDGTVFRSRCVMEDHTKVVDFWDVAYDFVFYGQSKGPGIARAVDDLDLAINVGLFFSTDRDLRKHGVKFCETNPNTLYFNLDELRTLAEELGTRQRW